MSNTRSLKSETLLLLTAMIWGFAFVAQRAGMDYVGPFTFNGVRFALGSVSLVPLMILTRRRQDASVSGASQVTAKTIILGGALTGTILFVAASLQQAGVARTTAGKAGFITGLYVIIVPLMGLLWGQRTQILTWVGALLAVVGLYLLSVTEGLRIGQGDLLVLIGAFFWAVHVHIISLFSSKVGALRLSLIQFVVCSGLSLATAWYSESVTWYALRDGLGPILYGGILSVGVAYTLQVVAQRDAHPARAAIILSSESLFAVVGGWVLLQEMLALRGIVGCALMLAGMILSQVTAQSAER